MRPTKSSLLFLAVASLGCLGPQRDPSTVEDLRVLGISLESPELMLPACDPENPLGVDGALQVLASPVAMTALIADPKGEGRSLHYEVLACAWPGDRTCEKDRVRLTAGETPPGELTIPLRPGALLLPDGRPLLQAVWEQDVYRGLGGLRMPLVLHVTAGEEEVYAQKLMVFSCRYFPQMQQNVTPKLRGLMRAGEEWAEAEVPVLQGAGPFEVQPQDFSDLQEPYVVPSFELEPVELRESWKISWHTPLGRMSPGETGGTDLGSQESRHRVEWLPPKEAVGQEVTFWAVVRDGRGGVSWLTRRARYEP